MNNLLMQSINNKTDKILNCNNCLKQQITNILTIKLNVKIIPNSKTNAIVGYLGGVLKIKVTAQAEKGKANKAVLNLLKDKLSIKKTHIDIISGKTTNYKILTIKNLSLAELNKKLNL